MTAAAAAAVFHELSPFGLALGVSRPGTKYPVRGIPHFDDMRRTAETVKRPVLEAQNKPVNPSFVHVSSRPLKCVH